MISRVCSNLCWLAPLAALALSPAHQVRAAGLSPQPDIPSATLGQPNGPARLDGAVVAGRTLAARAGDTLNLRDYGAYGDARSSSLLPVTAVAGSAALHVQGGAFGPADVGKRVIVDGAGPPRGLGYLAAISVTAPGSGYTSRPAITLTRTDGATNVVALPLMAVQSATVASGGAGCLANSVVTLTLPGGFGSTAAQFSGTTNSSGALAGKLTVITAGSYGQGTATDALLASAAQTPVAVGAGCTTLPILTPAWGLGGVQVVGQGAGLPLTGVAASITGSARLGTPVVRQVVTPLSARIIAVSGPADLVLDTAATTGVTASHLGLAWGHDDAPALAEAKGAADARFAAGDAYPVLYAPAGNYLVGSPTPTWSHQGGGIIGDGPERTVFKLDPAMSGALFSWSEDWFGGLSSPEPFPAGPTADLSRFYHGPLARDFSVLGDRTSAAEQDGLVLYDRNDRVRFENVAGHYLNGRMAYAGVALNVPTQAYMRESYWTDVYCDNCGAPGVPVFELSTLNTNGTGDSTNTNDCVNLMAWGSSGPGLVIRNNAPVTAKATTQLNFIGGRFEGGRAGTSADLVVIGDPVMTGPVSFVTFVSTRFIGGQVGAAGLRLTAPSAASQPFGITLLGASFSPMNGRGVVVTAGRNVSLDISGMSSVDTGVTIGPAVGGVSQSILVSGRGVERSWSWNVDATSADSVAEPLFRMGDPSKGNGTIVSNLHDGTATGGNATTAACVDMQTARGAAGQTCNATGGAILGGRNNTINAAGIGAVIPGGQYNIANGQFGFVTGYYASDLGLRGARVHAGGNFSGIGDGELVDQPLLGIARGTTPTRLTADLKVAGATNTLNLPPGGLYAFGRVTVAAFDPTSVNGCVWTVDGLIAKKGASAATTALVGTPTVTLVACDSALGMAPGALAVAADTTNGAVALTVTGKAGVNLHVVADGHFVAIQ